MFDMWVYIFVFTGCVLLLCLFSYPYSEDSSQGKQYMNTRCPAWCDRILLSASARELVLKVSLNLPLLIQFRGFWLLLKVKFLHILNKMSVPLPQLKSPFISTTLSSLIHITLPALCHFADGRMRCLWILIWSAKPWVHPDSIYIPALHPSGPHLLHKATDLSPSSESQTLQAASNPSQHCKLQPICHLYPLLLFCLLDYFEIYHAALQNCPRFFCRPFSIREHLLIWKTKPPWPPKAIQQEWKGHIFQRFRLPNTGFKFNFRGLSVFSTGTCRLSSVNVCERDAAVYCTGTVHSRRLLRKFGFLLSATNEKFLPDLSSLVTEAPLEQ